jgi:LysR family glycine cleavage system transcriptional activator
MTRDAVPPLEPLRAFIEAGRRLSFLEAARILGLTPSAVSHRIRALEAWAGTALFIRTARQVTLTKAGRALLRDAEAAFGRLAKAGARLRAQDSALKISALPLFLNTFLIPRLPRFTARHPDIALQLDATNRIADFGRDDIDVAIRNATSPPTGLAVRKLLDVAGIPLCTPSLAAKLKAPSDLAGMTLIHISARAGGWQRWFKAVGAGEIKAAGDVSFDSIPASLEAAARGQGVALGLDPISRDAARALGLVAPFGSLKSSESAYYLVHRKGDATRPAIRAFSEWLAAEVATFKRGP